MKKEMQGTDKQNHCSVSLIPYHEYALVHCLWEMILKVLTKVPYITGRSFALSLFTSVSGTGPSLGVPEAITD